jgi:hypothetical protein
VEVKKELKNCMLRENDCQRTHRLFVRPKKAIEIGAVGEGMYKEHGGCPSEALS